MRVSIPDRVYPGLSSGPRSAISQYRSLRRALTFSQDRRGFGSFISDNVIVSVSFIVGTLCCLVAVACTRFLSTQLLACPEWAVNCEVRSYIKWFGENLAIVQGAVTVMYSLGLALVISSMQKIAESAIWPLLTQQMLSIEQIESYLALTQGQMFSIRGVLQMRKTKAMTTFILLTILNIGTHFIVVPLVSIVFDLSDVPHQFGSTYQVGGGIDQPFAETNPPISFDTSALIEYQSWAKNILPEPMPEWREWLIDRTVLKEIGKFTASAVRTYVQVNCQEHLPAQYELVGSHAVRFATNMTKHNAEPGRPGSSDTVEVTISQIHPAITTWVDDFSFLTANKTSASIVFVSFNSKFEKCASSLLSGKDLKAPISYSSVLCDVQVELQDEVLHIRDEEVTAHQYPVLSDMASLHVSRLDNSTANATRSRDYNEIALWLAVGAILVGPSVSGAQPLFYRSKNESTTFVSSPESIITSGDWRITDLERFIRTSVGAVALSISRTITADRPPTVITSTAYVRKMVPERVAFLLIPLGIALLSSFVLFGLSVHLHDCYNIPSMRLAKLREVLKSSQTMYLSEKLVGDAYEYEEPSDLGSVQVMYGMTRGSNIGNHEMIAGLSLNVEPFDKVSGTLLRRLE